MALDQKTLTALAAGTIDILRKTIAPRDARLAALEARLSSLEARPLPKWCGVWQHGNTYDETNLVTHKGGLWIAVENDDPRAGGIGDLAIDRQVGVVMTDARGRPGTMTLRSGPLSSRSPSRSSTNSGRPASASI